MPADTDSFTPKTAPTWLDRATAFFAHEARRRVVASLNNTSELYESPDTYTEVTAAAIRWITARWYVMRATLPVMGKPGKVRSCQIRLPYADLFTTARQRAVLLSAF